MYVRYVDMIEIADFFLLFYAVINSIRICNLFEGFHDELHYKYVLKWNIFEKLHPINLNIQLPPKSHARLYVDMIEIADFFLLFYVVINSIRNVI